MTGLTCSQLDDVAAELALGVLPGNLRAAALAHLDQCQRCRIIVSDLADATDLILAAAPAVAPSRGFSRRATRSLAPPRSRPLPWRAAAASVAAAAVALSVAIVAPLPTTSSRPAPSPPGGAALAAPGVRMAVLSKVPGEDLSGVAFVNTSGSPWLLMAVTDREPSGSYVCDVHYADGRTVRVGPFSVRDGAGAWRQDLAPTTSRVTTVDVLSPDGALAARATFR